MRGVARTRLERTAIRAITNHGFNEYDCAGPELRRGGAPSGPFLNATIRTALSQIGPDIATPRPRTSYIGVGGGGPISTNL